jgi:hypothetical protein
LDSTTQLKFYEDKAYEDKTKNYVI